MKLLLINPKFSESFWSFKWAVDKILSDKRTINPPLGLATLAALTPDTWTVEIVDENIESIPLNPKADLIGICGMGVQFIRQSELLTYFHKKGYYVVAGGSYASLCPESYNELADSVIAGEAEYIWKEFCTDFEKGKVRKLYQETNEVDIADSPVPRFDLLKLDKYQRVSLQFSRGCPYNCEFCDIIVMFGRKPRTKSVEQIGAELDLLRSLGVANLFFVDDNLIGNKPVAKKLLTFLVEYQNRYNYVFNFGTEASINLAHDKELLQLFHQANFRWVFIGIESPDEESLKETNKMQNLREDLLTSIRRIYSHGIEVFGGFIIGFDNDTFKTFDNQFNFIMKSGIQTAMIGLLTALPKTPLYFRLQKEGRLIENASAGDNTKLGTNVIPKQMDYSEMINDYHLLYYRLLSPQNIAARIKNKIRFLGHPNFGVVHSFKEQFYLFKNFVLYGLLKGGLKRWYHFLKTIPIFKPLLLPVVIQDWVVGLSMRDYVERHFHSDYEKINAGLDAYLKIIERVLKKYVKIGSLDISLQQVKNAAANFSFSFNGLLDKKFFRCAGKQIEKLLKNTKSSITLNISEFNEKQVKHLNRLLKKLSCYGDRVHIVVDEKIRHIIEIDSSIFNLVMDSVPVRV